MVAFASRTARGLTPLVCLLHVEEPSNRPTNVSHPSINWDSIREHHGSKGDAFEELCCQLANRERPAGSTLVRKGTPDAGVECYAVLEDGSEWAWQAKYFTSSPGASQWAQIDESVKAALAGHPGLVRYFVCLPIDLPDARQEGQQSARDRWKLHVQKWRSWASEKSMDVGFELWGSYELTDRLIQPENAGRIAYWFDTSALSTTWFSGRIEEALKEAGARYTPQIHVDLPVSQAFSGIARTPAFFDRQKARAIPIRKALHQLGHLGATGDAVRVLQLDDTRDGLVDARDLTEIIHRPLAWFEDLAYQPTGSISFGDALELVDASERRIDELVQEVREKGREWREAQAEAPDRKIHAHSDPFDSAIRRLYGLQSDLSTARFALTEASQITEAPVVLLSGRAGTGKSHLLCDLTSSMLSEGHPTVLLMGQRFIGLDDPWRQALGQLDLPGLGADQFVGALEACAEAAGRRALFVIDALNEGAGRKLWPSTLASFLERLVRSEWISVVVSVRTPLEEVILPDEVREQLHEIRHEGFSGVEYDAMKTFFDYYGLERPSAPLLVPEFRNPLFLKVLCEGLVETGTRRLPRGFHGIARVFDLHLTAINARIARDFGYPRSRGYVQDAVHAFVRSFPDLETPWIPVDDAESVVAKAVPVLADGNRLYMALVGAGVLVETVVGGGGSEAEVVARLAYDRLGNYLAVAAALESRTVDDVADVFTSGPLALVSEANGLGSSGLVESICTQLPERFDLELVDVVADANGLWCYADAFRQSVLWRSPGSVTERTWSCLIDTVEYEADERALMELLLKLATVPEHPFNADLLDELLRSREMAERDAFWSTYLHLAWGDEGPVDRLVEWAWHGSGGHEWDTDSVRLASIALGWMLSTPNRFLRDRATKALVSLLTPKPELWEGFLRSFGTANDPYVAERAFAVALGCVLRKGSRDRVGQVAACAYELVFEPAATPLHLLLRDYARGIVEWALHLGAELPGDEERVRPPYRSKWPTMPEEEDVEEYRSDWSKGSHDGGDEGWWSRNRIWSSVIDDDFGRYVIESRFSSWLTARLDEPTWRSPRRRLEILLAEATQEVTELVDLHGDLHRVEWISRVRQKEEGTESEEGQQADEKELTDALGAVEAELLAQLPETGPEVCELLRSRWETGANSPPSFDTDVIKRYVVKRVFELGWTMDRFGYFDRVYVGHRGRSAEKAERMGKKYQWIALHEMAALVADHYQYIDEWAGAESYLGPWQGWWRDIDPTCLLGATVGSTGFGPHTPSWWAPALYEAWPDGTAYREWTAVAADLPDIGTLLRVRDSDGTWWLSLYGHYSWQEPTPADKERHDRSRGDLWYLVHAYIVRRSDEQAFRDWSRLQDFWGRWMPDPPTHTALFLGEIGWSPAARYFDRPYFGAPRWESPKDCPVEILGMSEQYLAEKSGFDCSMDEGVTLQFPTRALMDGIGLRWGGAAADFRDVNGRLVTFDPTAVEGGPDALLVREDAVRDFLAAGEYALVWVVLGEKRELGGGLGAQRDEWSALRVSGPLTLASTRPTGTLNATFLDGSRDDEGNLIGRSQTIEV